MVRMSALVLLVGLLVGGVGCSHERPGDYARQRPAVDKVREGDVGLESKDLVDCTDQMVRSLLMVPELRGSPTQWTLVVDRVEDRTLDRCFRTNYDIFIERLRVALGRAGAGNVTVVENKAKLQQLRSRELDGGEQAAVSMGRVQPQYALYAKAFDLPNRTTNTYTLAFIVTDMQRGTQIWMDEYTVKATR